MSALSGATGNCTVPTGTGYVGSLLITRWQADATRDIHIISHFDDALNEHSKLGGMLHMTGTIEGVIDDSAMPLLTQMQTEDLVTTANLRLISRRGAVLDAHWIMEAMISNTSVDVTKIGVQRYSMTFESLGAITTQEHSDV